MSKFKLHDSPTERTTAATDAALALLALGCTLYLGLLWAFDPWKVLIWLSAFGLLALAALLGALAHGLKISPLTHRRLWAPLNLLLAGVIALFVTGVCYDAWGLAVAQRVLPLMLGAGLLFFGLTFYYPDTFLIFIAYQGLAMIFALGVYGVLALTGSLPGAGLMALGILVTIIAAAIQTNPTISLRLIWPFDHNGVYHLVQMAGVLLLVVGIRAELLA